MKKQNLRKWAKQERKKLDIQSLSIELVQKLQITEEYKQAKNIFAEVSFHHLRPQDGKEVDLLVENQHGYYAFEIKMAERVSKIDARHLTGLNTILDKPLLHSFIISNDPETHHISDNITAVHAAMFLG